MYNHFYKPMLILLSIVTLASCVKEESTLEGDWYLVNVTCECEPSQLDYGDHKWMFNLDEGMLRVDNKVDKPLQVLESDTYDLLVEQDSLVIGERKYGYYFENARLFLADQPELDGPLMEFRR